MFIYLFEGRPALADRVAQLRRRMLARGDRLYTSTLSVAEVLVKPFSAQRTDLTDRYLAFFRHPRVTILPFDLSAATSYARIRQDQTIKPPDAIQLACAASAEIDLFVTNDARLSQKVIPGIKFISNLAQAQI